jgi:hypothetical protein
MPSVGEIFTVSGAAVGAGVDVAFCVAGMTKGIDVSEVSDVGVIRAGVEVGEEGVEMLWQAARKMMGRRSGMNFFIGFYL